MKGSWDKIVLLGFNKITIQGTHWLAVDKEAIGLSSVHNVWA